MTFAIVYAPVLLLDVRVCGLGFRDIRFVALGFGIRVQGIRFGDQGLIRVWRLGFRR